MEDMESLYDYYEKEQAYLSAEKEHIMYMKEYLHKVVRFTITGDSLPLYMLVVDFNEELEILHCIIIRSYCPEYGMGEYISVGSQHTVIIDDFDIVEHKNNTEILF